MPTTPHELSPQVFHILLALADQELHGYAIIQDIEARTDGRLRLTASTLYAALRRLLEDGLITEVTTRGAGEDARRRCYRLTTAGRAAGKTEAARLEALADLARTKRWLPARRPR